MTRHPRISKTRLEEMTEEATVDCYNDSEKVTGWFTMIEENVSIPFEATVLGVSVIVEKVDLTSADQIIARCARGRHRQAIPLVDLPLPDPPPRGWEWIEAYQLWDAQTGGSQFFEE